MNYATAKDCLVSAGYIPLPIKPNSKRPAIRDWTSDGYRPVKGFGNCGVGIRCGVGEHPIVAVDIDILDSAIATQVYESLVDRYGVTVCRIGNAPKRMLLYRADKAGYRKLRSAEFDFGHIEVMGDGQQIVAFGIHPDTQKEYEWNGILGSIAEIPARALPILKHDDIRSIIKEFEVTYINKGHRTKEEGTKTAATDFDPGDPLDRREPMGMSFSELKHIVNTFDPDCKRDMWRNVGMAIHHETSGSPEGFAVWDDWSARGVKYKAGEMFDQWDSFGRYTGCPITARTLIKLSKEIRDEKEKIADTNLFKTLDWSPARFATNPPPIPMVVYNFLPKGITSLFYSAGGVGKSTLVLNLAVRIALADKYETTFFDNSISGGSVVILTAEDPELILNRRYIDTLLDVAEKENIPFNELRGEADSKISIVSTFGHSVQLFSLRSDGTLKITEYYKALLDSLLEIQDLKLIVIDTKTRYSPGEGLGNVTATQEITYYENIARKTGATVMLLHHTNKGSRDGSQSGMQAYRDATALYDSVRAAWYLRPLTDSERVAQNIADDDPASYLMLENSKNNYIACHEPWVIQRQGFSYGKQKMQPKLSSTEKKVRQEQECYSIFIQVMQRHCTDEVRQGELLKMCADATSVSFTKARKLIDQIVEDGYIEKSFRDRAVWYALTPEGVSYGLTVE